MAVVFVSQCELQLKHLSAQKVGSPTIPEIATRSAQNRVSCALLARFCAALGALSGIGGNPTFCADECSRCLRSVARLEKHKAGAPKGR